MPRKIRHITYVLSMRHYISNPAMSICNINPGQGQGSSSSSSSWKGSPFNFFFNGASHDKAMDCGGARLPPPMNAVDGLSFHGSVQQRLEHKNVVRFHLYLYVRSSV